MIVPRPGGPERSGPRRPAGSEFVWGVRLLARGFGMYAKYPRLLLLGLIPAFLAFVVLVAAFGVLIVYLDDVGRWLTSLFADGWSSGARTAVALLLEVALLIGSVWLAVLTYTALTLVIGDPFYERISRQVEERLGGVSDLPDLPDLPWYRTLPRSIADSLRLVARGVLLAAPTLLIGLVPVVGQVVAPVVGALIGGWVLSIELTGIPFTRRGMFLAERRRLLRANRALALGFGVPVAVLALIPFANIVVVPAAIAGGTLLTRRILGQPID